MTRDDAKKFIDDVLKGIWPSWNPTDMQYETWIYVSSKYDFENARQALRNWSIEQEKLYKEPNIAKVKRILQAAKNKNEGITEREPILLYEIIKESRYRKSHIVALPNGENVEVSDEHGKPFYSTSREMPDRHLIERRAEADRKNHNEIYGENHIIRYVGKNTEEDNHWQS